MIFSEYEIIKPLGQINNKIENTSYVSNDQVSGLTCAGDLKKEDFAHFHIFLGGPFDEWSKGTPPCLHSPDPPRMT